MSLQPEVTKLLSQYTTMSSKTPLLVQSHPGSQGTSIWTSISYYIRCKPFIKAYRNAQRAADDKVNTSKLYAMIFMIYVSIFIIFVLCPLSVFIKHSQSITASTNDGVETSEYFFLFGFWLYFGILTSITECLKAISVDKFVNFDNVAIPCSNIKRFLFNEVYYYICGWICPIIIAFIPCILRISHHQHCFNHNYGLFIIIWNAIALEIFIGLRFLRACRILSYRIATSYAFATKAIEFWSADYDKQLNQDLEKANTFLNEEMVELWASTYLRRPLQPIRSITRRRVFYFTMLSGITLPMITLILIIVLPYNDIFYSSASIQLICIMFIFETYILILIGQSAYCDSKWKKSISKYHDRLFGSKNEEYRNECNINYHQIVTYYLPIYNYWSNQFFGLKFLGFRLDWSLFFKLFSLMFINIAVYYIKSSVKQRL